MDEKSILAENLTFYRKQNGFSQIELAKKLNYSNKNISKWEKGETMPNAFILGKIAKIYNITIEDLISPRQNENIEEQSNNSKRKEIIKNLFRVGMLFLANAILYAVATAIFYALRVADIDSFNLWYIYLYLTPLTFLSITIYIRVLYKIVDIFSISAFSWLICVSIYVTLSYVKHMALIFALGAVIEIIEICIAFLINIKVFNKMPKIFKNFNKSKEDKK